MYAIRSYYERIRHHASLAMWCGNNELEQMSVTKEWTEHRMSWNDYSIIFDKILADVSAEFDPQRDYWPGSPHTPIGDRNDYNNPDSGDAHVITSYSIHYTKLYESAHVYSCNHNAQVHGYSLPRSADDDTAYQPFPSYPASATAIRLMKRYKHNTTNGQQSMVPMF